MESNTSILGLRQALSQWYKYCLIRSCGPSDTVAKVPRQSTSSTWTCERLYGNLLQSQLAGSKSLIRKRSITMFDCTERDSYPTLHCRQPLLDMSLSETEHSAYTRTMCLQGLPAYLPSMSVTCKIWGFHGDDYEEYRFLGYKNPVCNSQETHYVSATEPSRLMRCRIGGSRGCDYEEYRLLACAAAWPL
jgi:hypothetical protein